MKDFLNELKDILIKHDATILRSASETHLLVVSIYIENSGFDEIEFDEEINDAQIKHGWFKQL